MKDLSDAAPDAMRDAELILNINHALFASFEYLLFEAKQHFGIKIEQALNNLKTIVDEDKTLGILHALHQTLKRTIQYGEVKELRRAVTALEKYDLRGHRLNIHSLGDATYRDEYSDIIMRSIMANDPGQHKAHFQIEPVSQSDASQSIQQCDYALKVLKEVDIDSFAEVNQLISDIVILHSTSIHAFTSYSTLGNLYMSHIKPEEIWLRYYEHIVHEAAHCHLYLAWSVEPVLIKGTENERFYSPYRREKRPIDGVFHALFVLARTLYSFNKLRKHAKYAYLEERISQGLNYPYIEEPYETRFLKVYEEVEKNAKLTDYGTALLESAYQITGL